MKKRVLIIVTIILLATISMLPILTEPDILGHDTNFHVANINELTEDIKENIIPHRLLNDAGNGFGYGTHLFYPPLPHTVTAYLNVFLSNFHLTTLDTITITYYLITLTTAFLIFYLAKKLSNHNLCALLATTIYLFFPYRLGNIIVRGALNEVFTFLFIPLIFIGLYHLIDKKPKYFLIFFVLGYVGLLYSHLVLALFFTILMIPFLWIYRKTIFQKDHLKIEILSVCIITALALPMLTTLFVQKSGANYLVFKENYLSGLIYLQTYNNTLKDYFVPLSDYSWEVPRYIPLLTFLFFLLSLYAYIKEEKKTRILTFLLYLTGISFLLSLSFFPWEIMPHFLYMIQFSWRLETILLFSMSLSAIYFFTKIKKYQNQIVIVVIILSLITSIPLLQKLSTHTYLTTSQVEDNLAMGHSQEYLPEKVKLNETYYQERDHEIHNTSNNDTIITIEKAQNEYIKFHVSNLTEETTIELPRIFYTGYQLTNDTKQYSVFENEKGFVSAIIDQDGTYELKFQKTTIEHIATILSLAGFTTWIIAIKKNHS